MTSSQKIPENFEIYAANENDTKLGQRYGMSRRSIAKIRNKLGIESCVGSPAIRHAMKPPADFRQIAIRNVTNKAIAEHYGVGDKTITRWRRETGVTAPVSGRSAGIPYMRTLVDTRPTGLIADAADFLRNKGFAVYNRVIEDKKLDGQYVVGRMHFDSAEAMIEYAQSRGMKPSQW